MPKSTFFNLAKDKIDKIIKVSINEFVEYSYENASINRIVEDAEIAKGSFYQYFEDKKDLYKYIVEEAHEKKKLYFVDVLKNQNGLDYFDLLKDIFLTEIKFARELPKLTYIILDFSRSRHIEFKREILTDTSFFNSVYEELTIKGIDNRALDDDTDIALNVYLLKSLNISIVEYFIYETNLDYEKTINYIDNIIELFRDGVKAKKRIKRNFEDRFY